MIKAVGSTALIKRGEKGGPAWPLEREKIIKNEGTFTHSFLLLVSLAMKYVTVHALRRQRYHAVCPFSLSRSLDLYCRLKNHLLSMVGELTKAKMTLVPSTEPHKHIQAA